MNITYSESFQSFLSNSDCEIAKVLIQEYTNYNNDIFGNYVSEIVTNEKIDYLTFRTDGSISYLPKGKPFILNDNGEWAREGRQNGAASKVIRKLFTKKGLELVKDVDFECFSNSYKSNFSEEGYKFEILPNTRIKEVYDMEIIATTNSLGGSCMNGDSRYMDIYKECKQLEIVVLKDKNSNLAGRALLWTIEKIKLIDRFYVLQDFQYDMFLKFAKDNSFWRKKHYKTYDSKQTFITPEDEEIDKIFKIHTDTDFDEFPYIDTFSYGGDGYLTNTDCSEYTYDSTDGNRNPQEDDHYGETWDELNDRYINDDDSVYIERGRYRNCSIHHESAVQIGNYYWWEGDEDIIEVNGEWYEKADENLCYVDDEYVLMDDCVIDEDTQEWILEENSIEVGGKYYSEDSDSIVEIRGSYYLVDSEDVIMSEEGEYELA